MHPHIIILLFFFAANAYGNNLPFGLLPSMSPDDVVKKLSSDEFISDVNYLPTKSDEQLVIAKLNDFVMNGVKMDTIFVSFYKQKIHELRFEVEWHHNLFAVESNCRQIAMFLNEKRNLKPSASPIDRNKKEEDFNRNACAYIYSGDPCTIRIWYNLWPVSENVMKYGESLSFEVNEIRNLMDLDEQKIKNEKNVKANEVFGK